MKISLERNIALRLPILLLFFPFFLVGCDDYDHHQVYTEPQHVQEVVHQPVIHTTVVRPVVHTTVVRRTIVRPTVVHNTIVRPTTIRRTVSSPTRTTRTTVRTRTSRSSSRR